jgi:hypothetical protein
VLQTLLQGGQVVLEEQNVHLLTEKQIGAGKILFLAFDLQHPPFSRWTGREKFWEYIQTLRPESMHVTVDTDKQTLLEALLKSMPAGFPDKRLAFALVGLYLLLFKLITVSFGKRGVKNWRVIGLTFVLILLFSGGSYGIFFYPNQRQRLAYDSILHVHASGDRSVAVGEFILGVYGLKNTAYTFGFGETVYPIKPLVAHAAYKQTPAPYILQHTDTEQRVQGTLDKWSYNFFTFSTSLDFQMSARAKHDAQEGLSLAFENPTPHKLNATYGYFAGRLFPLGTIATDATTTISLSTSKIQEQKLFDTAQLRTLFATISDTTRLPFWQQIQQELTKYLLTNIQQTYNEREDLLVLVGWIASPLIEAQFTHSGVIGASATLVTWAIPVE